MKIKIDAADKVFSQYIRLRDMECKRCHSKVKLNDKGLPISHQNSHYFGRGKESTRFNENNCDCLCFSCHKIWGSEEKEEYRDFKIKQLGIDGFNRLKALAHLTVKKDRKFQLLRAKELLKTVLK